VPDDTIVRPVSAATEDVKPPLVGAAATAYALLSVAMLSWATNLILGRALAGIVGPFTLSWSRWFVATLVVLPFAGRALWTQRAVLRRDWKLLLVLGVIGFAGSNTFCYLALQHTTAVNASLINAVGPLLISAAAVFVLGETFRLRQGVGLAIALLGVAVVVLRGDPQALYELEINIGDLFMLTGVLAWCVYSIRLRERPPELSPVTLVAALFIIGMLTLTPFAAWEAKLEPSPAVFAAILYAGVFPSVVSILCWNRALALIGAARASMFTYLMPLLAAFLAMLFLGETIALFHVVGGGLIFAGLALALVTRR
jgi:drug/metabolite transporter (DMT)-like permease